MDGLRQRADAPLWSPGHTPGSTSFVFDVEDPGSGERLTFGYMGGYGWSPKTVTATNGWQRLGFAHNLAWLQQRWGDVDYAAPQHANQFPLVDINQALVAYNNDPANADDQLTTLDGLTTDEFTNQLEKRYAVATNKVSDEQPGYQSIEAYGPFKPGREEGVTDAEVTLVDGGRVIQGYDRAMNVNPKIPLLADGVEIALDGHVHDPQGWYVQFELDVDDSYAGFLPGVGPVESIRPEATEILRTQRFGSRAEAEAVLSTVQAGAPTAWTSRRPVRSSSRRTDRRSSRRTDHSGWCRGESTPAPSRCRAGSIRRGNLTPSPSGEGAIAQSVRAADS